jgi:hypothetical protein
MVRTPPRPIDIAQLFPELREHAATATRLHPRPGSPTAADSSVGGPLRWPAGEPWPMCAGAEHYVHRLLTPATVRRQRRIYAAAKARAAATGVPYHLTDAERAETPAFDFSEPHDLARAPTALVPVAQLYRRDIPDFVGPDGADLLQVLWCPLDHPDDGYNPRVELFWRRAADVTVVLDQPPEPTVVNDNYLPTPCVVRPEQVGEYQYADLLPEELRSRIEAWEEETGNDYQFAFSLAPGWKVGGFASWSLSDPQPMECAECGAAQTLLLTAATGEWDGPDDTWRPAGDGSVVNPAEVVIGRGYDLYVFICPRSFEHPPATAMQ